MVMICVLKVRVVKRVFGEGKEMERIVEKVAEGYKIVLKVVSVEME